MGPALVGVGRAQRERTAAYLGQATGGCAAVGYLPAEGGAGVVVAGRQLGTVQGDGARAGNRAYRFVVTGKVPGGTAGHRYRRGIGNHTRGNALQRAGTHCGGTGIGVGALNPQRTAAGLGESPGARDHAAESGREVVAAGAERGTAQRDKTPAGNRAYRFVVTGKVPGGTAGHCYCGGIGNHARSTTDQRARAHRGGAGIGVGARQRERAAAGFADTQRRAADNARERERGATADIHRAVSQQRDVAGQARSAGAGFECSAVERQWLQRGVGDVLQIQCRAAGHRGAARGTTQGAIDRDGQGAGAHRGGTVVAVGS